MRIFFLPDRYRAWSRVDKELCDSRSFMLPLGVEAQTYLRYRRFNFVGFVLFL